MRGVLIFIAVTIFLGISSIFIFKAIKGKVAHDLSQPVYYAKASPTPQIKVEKGGQVKKSVFIPYWSVGKANKASLADFDSLIYFGIIPNESGIDKSESGWLRIEDFLSSAPPDKEKLLTLRMIDQKNNFAILKNESSQKKIIKQTIDAAKEKGFSGIVVDLEISAMPFDSLIAQINNFTASFYKEAKAEDLSLSLAVYGDTFYRLRPLDMKVLSNNADNIMVMAYDFHKAKGNPGPNFPLNGREKYGYDLKKMTDDFLSFVPGKKLTIIFGLFGYDWTLIGSGDSSSQAEPLSYLEISHKFLEDCLYADCAVERDEVSGEMRVEYKDENDKRHEVWFEDVDSSALKENYLKEKGLTSFSYWAYSYF